AVERTVAAVTSIRRVVADLVDEHRRRLDEEERRITDPERAACERGRSRSHDGAERIDEPRRRIELQPERGKPRGELAEQPLGRCRHGAAEPPPLEPSTLEPSPPLGGIG